MTELELKNKRKDELTLDEIIKNQNVKPINSMEEFYSRWQDDPESDKLYDFIMKERMENRKIKNE